MMNTLRLLSLLTIAWLFCAVSLRAQPDEDNGSLTEQLDILLERTKNTPDRDASSALAKEAYDLSRGTQNHGAFCRAALILAQNAQADRRPLDAIKYYVEANDRSKNLQEVPLINQINLGLGSLYMSEKVYKSAAEIYTKALEQEPHNERIIQLIGDAWLAERVLDSVDVYYNQLIDIYQKRGDYASEVRYYQRLIDTYAILNNEGMVLANYHRIENILYRFGTPAEKALIHNNLGKLYLDSGNYTKALEYLNKANLQCQHVDCPASATQLVNTAVCNFNLGNTRECVQNLENAIKILEKQKDDAALAHTEELFSGVYLKMNDLRKAQIHNGRARAYAEKSRDLDALALSYERAADIHFELYAYDEAIAFYKRYLVLNDSLRSLDKNQIQRQADLKTQLERSERETRGALFSQEIKNSALREAEKDKLALAATNRALAAESKQKEDALLKLEERKKLTEAELSLQSLLALKAQQELRLAAQESDAARRQKEDAAKLHAQEIEARNQDAVSSRQKSELELLQRDKEINAMTLKENETFRKYAGIGASMALMILGLLTAGWAYSKRANRRLNTQNKAIEQQKAEIDAERQRSDRLLLNILPEEIATELKETGIATPRVYEHVSVLFTDFESFTKITAPASPELVLAELNTCFQAFDLICDRYQLEKIKTIGDAYMAAAGVPKPDAQSAISATNAALEMLDFLEQRKNDPNTLLHRMRIGIHSGQVVAGVVGKNKFAYDIWGDTVNTAARMEEFGQPGRVNVSEATAQLLKSHFDLTDRGLLAVHNKGEMRMFFVEKQAKV
jgi:adenylate cyclase